MTYKPGRRRLPRQQVELSRSVVLTGRFGSRTSGRCRCAAHLAATAATTDGPTRPMVTNHGLSGNNRPPAKTATRRSSQPPTLQLLRIPPGPVSQLSDGLASHIRRADTPTVDLPLEGGRDRFPHGASGGHVLRRPTRRECPITVTCRPAHLSADRRGTASPRRSAEHDFHCRDRDDRSSPSGLLRPRPHVTRHRTGRPVAPRPAART